MLDVNDAARDYLIDIQNQKLRKIDDLPEATGIYALADHLGEIHYIGITAAKSFRDRIYSRHVNGSEERSHKLACNYNIGRMFRDRKSPNFVPSDARIAKSLRREFIRRHCRAACVPLNLPEIVLKAIERVMLQIAPSGMTSWNATRERVNTIPEPRDLVDQIVEDLRFSVSDRQAIERQNKLFESSRDNDAINRKSATLTRPSSVQADDLSLRTNEPSIINTRYGAEAPHKYIRMSPSGERFIAARSKDGLFRMADPAHGKVKHHAKNQTQVRFDQIEHYLSRGFSLRMRRGVERAIKSYCA